MSSQLHIKLFGNINGKYIDINQLLMHSDWYMEIWMRIKGVLNLNGFN